MICYEYNQHQRPKCLVSNMFGKRTLAGHLTLQCTVNEIFFPSAHVADD